jgi:hypothetical protein
MRDAPDDTEEFELVADEEGDGETMATDEVLAGADAGVVDPNGPVEPLPVVGAEDDDPAVPADADPELAVANGSRELWEM